MVEVSKLLGDNQPKLKDLMRNDPIFQALLFRHTRIGISREERESNWIEMRKRRSEFKNSANPQQLIDTAERELIEHAIYPISLEEEDL